MDEDEPTQATQNVLDPRRVGKQNSGFSDDDISDIICVLYPHSDAARLELQRLALEDSPHIIGKHEADDVEPDYEQEDHASKFQSAPANHGNYAIMLRLSAQVKSPAAGFVFGRNTARCDVVFANDPYRRVSNIHFRIFVNEYGVVMIEDQSTNGTCVDRQLLTRHPKNVAAPPVTRWTLSSGSEIRICLHAEMRDLSFRVRVPRRDDEYDRAYIAKVEDHFARHGLKPIPDVPAPRTGGHVDLFKTPGDPAVQRTGLEPATTAPAPRPSASRRKDAQSAMPKEWTGSGTYNRTGTLGKGAFAVVYKVTSKYDGKPYAAKEIEKRRFIKNGVLDQKVENEMKIMRRVQHPNIVRYMENFEWDDRLLIIIMEYVPNGDLGRIVTEQEPFPEDMAQVMSRQLLSALGYLHANNITHRDVKPDNILINTLEPLEVKLTDFGLSKMVETEQTFLTTFCGTLLYCAPEVYTEYGEYDDHGVRSRGKRSRRVTGQRYSHAVDIWSLGGVLFFALTGKPPYPVKSGISHSELLHKIMTTMLNISPLERVGVSEQGIDFLHRMLQRRPENRATIPELESHAWLGGRGSVVEASQSYDEITDDEDVLFEPSQFRPAPYGVDDDDDDRISDSASEKENDAAPQRKSPPRLFGEVGVSAIGSSGVLPADYLRLSADNTSRGETEILDMHRSDSDDESGDSDTVRGMGAQAYHYNTTSVYPNQSTDQLQSLVEDVASQSLGGGRGSETRDLNSLSQYSWHSADPGSSKRKPASHDEMNENTPPGKPIIKRLKSDGDDDDVSDDIVREFRLLARVPQIKRLHSGRQIDSPVMKEVFWEQDRATWHLQYPEMTQLQYDAFSQAARDRGEEFGPGRTPLWDLAMKYFCPCPAGARREGGAAALELRRDDRKLSDDLMEMPSTAAPVEAEARQAPPLPPPPPPQQQQQLPDTQIVVPIQADSGSRALAAVESLPESCVTGIRFFVTDTLASFGRGFDNTEIFPDRREPRVPKFAFKMLLWREGYDPSKDSSKLVHPWNRPSSADDESYHFWISTKATLGIRINGYNLPSSDAKNYGGPSHYWAKIHDGDELMVWGGQDPRFQTNLVFRCFWGGSAKPRPDARQSPELASPAWAHKLDSACQRTERRMREAAERQRRMDEAKADHQERKRCVEMERERSHAFERRRLEAVEYLAAMQQYQQQQQLGSRRASPACAPSTTLASRLQTATLAPPRQSR
ncbi:hypothetical protein CDD83_447 [Cordyceps sp. RAO-2017]|nr:hypothetical protein CDD83_447 [Cordyceps sp. RAO-2017]